MPWPPFGGRRPDETPLRTTSGVIRDEASPGTPHQPTPGVRPTIISPRDVMTTRWNNRAQRALALGRAAGIDGYVLDAFLAVAMNRFEDEDRFPDETIMSGVAIVTSAAGNAPAAQLFNPANSGLLVTLDEVWINSSVADQWSFLLDVAQFATQSNYYYRDTRAGGASAVALGATLPSVRQALSPVIPFQINASTRVQAGVDLTKRVSFVLIPGQALDVAASTNGVATALVTFVWRQKPFLPTDH